MHSDDESGDIGQGRGGDRGAQRGLRTETGQDECI